MALCLASGQKADSLQGRLLEDLVSLYLKKMIAVRQLAATLEYDYSTGGADFIISYLNQAYAPIAIRGACRSDSQSGACHALREPALSTVW